MLQVSTGGGVDEKDILDKNIDIENTIKREAMEELKMNLNDKENIFYNRISYIYISENNEQPGVKIIAKAKSKMTAEEIKKHFEEYFKYLNENNLELEFKKLHFLKKDKAIDELNKLRNPRRNYLMPLLQMEFILKRIVRCLFILRLIYIFYNPLSLINMWITFLLVLNFLFAFWLNF